MSEYWVSKKKYRCTYCDIFITDDTPSRQQHESGLRHQGNKARFVKQLYKQGERQQKDREEERREMQRIDAAAQAAFANDVSSGHAGPSKAAAASKPEPRKPAPLKPTDKWSNYSTAASLGYTDPDVELRKIAGTVGVAGQWEIVAPSPPPPPPAAPSKTEISAEVDADTSETIRDSSKRDASSAAVDEDDTRHFKLRKRTMKSGFLDDHSDSIPIKLKVKSEAPKETFPLHPPPNELSATVEPVPNGSDLPKWTTRGWKKPGELPQDPGTETPLDSQPNEDASSLEAPLPQEPPADDGEPIIKQEDGLDSLEKSSIAANPSASSTGVKLEPGLNDPPNSSTGMFKKRKAPTSRPGRR